MTIGTVSLVCFPSLRDGKFREVTEPPDHMAGEEWSQTSRVCVKWAEHKFKVRYVQILVLTPVLANKRTTSLL